MPKRNKLYLLIVYTFLCFCIFSQQLILENNQLYLILLEEYADTTLYDRTEILQVYTRLYDSLKNHDDNIIRETFRDKSVLYGDPAVMSLLNKIENTKLSQLIIPSDTKSDEINSNDLDIINFIKKQDTFTVKKIMLFDNKNTSTDLTIKITDHNVTFSYANNDFTLYLGDLLRLYKTPGDHNVLPEIVRLQVLTFMFETYNSYYKKIIVFNESDITRNYIKKKEPVYKEYKETMSLSDLTNDIDIYYLSLSSTSHLLPIIEDARNNLYVNFITQNNDSIEWKNYYLDNYRTIPIDTTADATHENVMKKIDTIFFNYPDTFQLWVDIQEYNNNLYSVLFPRNKLNITYLINRGIKFIDRIDIPETYDSVEFEEDKKNYLNKEKNKKSSDYYELVNKNDNDVYELKDSAKNFTIRKTFYEIYRKMFNDKKLLKKNRNTLSFSELELRKKGLILILQDYLNIMKEKGTDITKINGDELYNTIFYKMYKSNDPPVKIAENYTRAFEFLKKFYFVQQINCEIYDTYLRNEFAGTSLADLFSGKFTRDTTNTYYELQRNKSLSDTENQSLWDSIENTEYIKTYLQKSTIKNQIILVLRDDLTYDEYEELWKTLRDAHIIMHDKIFYTMNENKLSRELNDYHKKILRIDNEAFSDILKKSDNSTDKIIQASYTAGDNNHLINDTIPLTQKEAVLKILQETNYAINPYIALAQFIMFIDYPGIGAWTLKKKRYSGVFRLRPYFSKDFHSIKPSISLINNTITQEISMAEYNNLPVKIQKYYEIDTAKKRALFTGCKMFNRYHISRFNNNSYKQIKKNVKNSLKKRSTTDNDNLQIKKEIILLETNKKFFQTYKLFNRIDKLDPIEKAISSTHILNRHDAFLKQIEDRTKEVKEELLAFNINLERKIRNVTHNRNLPFSPIISLPNDNGSNGIILSQSLLSLGLATCLGIATGLMYYYREYYYGEYLKTTITEDAKTNYNITENFDLAFHILIFATFANLSFGVLFLPISLVIKHIMKKYLIKEWTKNYLSSMKKFRIEADFLLESTSDNQPENNAASLVTPPINIGFTLKF